MSTERHDVAAVIKEMALDHDDWEPEDEQIEANKRLHLRMGCSMCGRDRTECLCDPSLCSKRSDGL